MPRPTSLRASLPGLFRTVRRFRPQIAKQRTPIAIGSFALVAEVAFRLLEPWPLKYVFDRVFQQEPSAAAAGPESPGGMSTLTLLVVASLVIVVLAGLRALAAYASAVSFALAGNRVLTEVRGELYRHLQHLSLSFHSRARQGDLLMRVTGDIGRLQEVTVTAALPLTVNSITLVGMFGVMLWLDWRLALLAFSVFPLFGLTLVRMSRRIRTVAKTQRELEGALASVASESLAAIEVVQAYSLEPRFEKSFSSSNARSMRDGVKAKRLAAGLERKTDVLVAIATGLVVFFGARAVMSGRLTPGDLVVFLLYLKSAFKPVRDMAKYAARIAKASASGERIVSLLDTRSDVREQPGARPAPRFAGAVRLDGVSLAYEPDREVLSGIDLWIKPGEHVALVGPSGSGKSSVAGLLLRLYDPSAGVVTIDGVDVREYTLASLRSQIAIVLQDSVLFHTTIRENISYGKAGASDAEIRAAAELAYAHEFVEALPNGYDTVVGERGVTLSGGEKQRIAIARAAIREAPIVVLDEPTTGLDRESERIVIDALARLSTGRTVVHIAHDYSTIEDVDRIVFLAGGRVQEDGSRAELLARTGPFAAMNRAASHSNGNGGAKPRWAETLWEGRSGALTR